MISHNEAEILISARQDVPLDPVVERELQTHLATCDQCRAFAIATERLSAGARALPVLPVGPRVRRNVMETVEASRNPFTRIAHEMQSGPIWAAAASILVLLFAGWLGFSRLTDNGGDTSSSQVAAVATQAPVTIATQTPTIMVVAADSVAVTGEPFATEPPVLLATSTPQQPIAPTVVAKVSAQDAAVQTTEETPAIADLTGDVGEPSPPATMQPTTTAALAARVTPQVSPTMIPSATASPTAMATDTPAPTATQAPPTPTATLEPTNTPAIEMIGAPETSDTGGGVEVTSPPIEPLGQLGGEQRSVAIERLGGSPETGSVATPSVATLQTSVATTALADVSERYDGIAGDPSGHLGLTPEGRLEFVAIPDAASDITDEGYRLTLADTQPGVVMLCYDGGCDTTMDAPESPDWRGDAPLGVLNNSVYFMRYYPDRTDVMAGFSQGTQVLDVSVVGTIEADAAPITVYESDGELFAWLSNGQWLRVHDQFVTVMPGGGANPSNVRFSPVASQGPLVGYFTNGSLVIASANAPGSPILTLAAEGIDFDVAPPGNQVAVIRGHDIVIYDMAGNEVTTYTGGDIQPGSLIWLRSGIVYVDRATGALYQIPDTAP